MAFVREMLLANAARDFTAKRAVRCAVWAWGDCRVLGGDNATSVGPVYVVRE